MQVSLGAECSVDRGNDADVSVGSCTEKHNSNAVLRWLSRLRVAALAVEGTLCESAALVAAPQDGVPGSTTKGIVSRLEAAFLALLARATILL